ncbi:MAG: Sir2 family NAD-dependent protein deacetylase [Actinobacteria bacterium]|nr:Sir2 family NAD-dependent protein deacetylase [Actinomycetota bacterium]
MVPLADAAAVACWVDAAERVVVLTGAGISTDSGIPDFRGPNGIWTKNPKAERMSHISHYVDDPEVRALSWQSRLAHPAWSAEPGPGHRALVGLERRGKLDTLVTQNIDGLHQKAGSDPARVIEVHGTMREVVCLGCAERAPMERALARVRAGETDPPCRSCGGILKSATVSFGQSLDPGDLDRAVAAARRAEVFLAVGTTLTVHPVARLPSIAARAGARVATLNGEPTDFDDRADAVLRGAIADLLPVVCRSSG